MLATKPLPGLYYGNIQSNRTNNISFGKFIYPQEHIDVARNIVKKFEYVRDFKAMLKDFKVFRNNKGELIFKNFDLVEDDYKGVCHHHPEKLLKDLKNSALEKHYRLNIKPVQEPKYFHGFYDIHFCVSAKPKGIKINDDDELIIDSVLQNVGTAKKLFYSVVDSKAEPKTTPDEIINKKGYYPLGYADKLGLDFDDYFDKSIIYMRADGSTFKLASQRPHSDRKDLATYQLNQIMDNTKNKDFKQFLLKVSDSKLFPNFRNGRFINESFI